MPHPASIVQTAFDLAATGKTGQALELCRTLGPDAPVVLTNVAATLSQRSQHVEAIALLRAALEINPHLLEAVATLSAALNEVGDFAASADLCRKAIDRGPVPPHIHNNLGNALHALGLQQQALPHFKLAARDLPDNPKVWLNLGNTALEAGDTDLAERAFVTAIDLTPHDGSLHRSLAMIHRYPPGDPHLAMMEELLPTATSWLPEDRMQLDFALGKAYDEQGRFDLAIVHLDRANRAKRATTPYDEAQAFGVMDAMERTVTPAFLAEHGGHGDDSAQPIFIVGMPRSGTTLVEQVLASLPQVHALGEVMTFQSCLSTAGAFPAQGSTAQWFENLGAAYVRELGMISPQFSRTVDKMPSNFIYAGLIHMALPHAKIIHLRRNPVDTCVSCYSRLFSGDQPFTYDLAELGRYYRRYAQVMEHWRKILPSTALIEVEYETLVADFEAQARRLLEFCGFDWNPVCLDFHKTPRSVKTASAAQVRQPLYKTSIGRYHQHTTHLQPLLNGLGIR